MGMPPHIRYTLHSQRTYRTLWQACDTLWEEVGLDALEQDGASERTKEDARRVNDALLACLAAHVAGATALPRPNVPYRCADANATHCALVVAAGCAGLLRGAQ